MNATAETSAERTASIARRIAVVSPIFGGSFPIAEAVRDALRELGHQVLWLDMRPLTQAYLAARRRDTSSAQQEFYAGVHAQLEQVLAAHPIELLIALAQAPLGQDFLLRLRGANIKSALWFVEDWQRFHSWRSLALKYDFFFRIQEEPFASALTRLGVTQHAYLPLAAHPPTQVTDPSATPDAYRAPLAFFGSPCPYRIELCSAVTEYGLALWGLGWDQVEGPLQANVRQGSQYLDQQVERAVYAGATITLNPHTRTTQSAATDFINPRTFYLAGAGCFQLVDQRSLLSRHFSPQEVVTFDSKRDLRAKAAYYLANAQARQQITAAARQRVIREHCYTQRMTQLLSHVWPVHQPDTNVQTRSRLRPGTRATRSNQPARMANER